MNREAREYNETVTPNSAQIERLRVAFPEYFDEQGSFMLDRFEQMLKEDDLNLTREGYELKFLGKSYAKYVSGLETETVVVPDLVHNAEPENKDSENLYIVGDNLDALQHLVKSYAGKVKCIYIDPPYNTGSDGFVYNDDFGFTAQQLVERIGIGEDEADRILDMQGKSSHSAWLTFMYPRLVLARELLSDDGVIFISIDENEFCNLSLLLDELFGEQNSLSELIWKTKYGGGNDSSHIVQESEYVIVYAKDYSSVSTLEGTSDYTKYALSDEYLAERGKYTLEALYRSSLQYSDSLFYPIECPDGTFIYPNSSNPDSDRHIWRWSKNTFQKRLGEGRVEFKKTRNGWRVFSKQYELQDDFGNPRKTQLRQNIPEIPGRNGSEELKSIFDGKQLFSNPKPVRLIQYLARSLKDPDCLYLDFFSGSATTAQAVMQLNADDGGNRRYIMVQLPESLEEDKVACKAGYLTIDEIGRERIKRAAAKIKEETGADMDYGFKLVRLESPSVKTLDELDAFDPNVDDLLAGDYVSKFCLDGTPGHDVILTTWLNQDGFGLLATSRKVELADYTLDVCEDSAYIINPGIASEDVQELVRLLEADELQLNRVVVFPYSVTFSIMHELKKNLSVLRSGQIVEVIERF